MIPNWCKSLKVFHLPHGQSSIKQQLCWQQSGLPPTWFSTKATFRGQQSSFLQRPQRVFAFGTHENAASCWLEAHGCSLQCLEENFIEIINLDSQQGANLRVRIHLLQESLWYLGVWKYNLKLTFCIVMVQTLMFLQFFLMCLWAKMCCSHVFKNSPKFANTKLNNSPPTNTHTQNKKGGNHREIKSSKN